MRIAPHDVIFLHDLVEPVGDDGEVGFEQAGQEVALRLHQVDDAQHAVVDVVEVHDRLVADERHLPADHRVHDFAERRGGAAELHEVASDREHVAWDTTLAVVTEHRLLQRVEAIVERVGHLEVAVDDHVEQRPEQEALLGDAVLAPLQLEAVLDQFHVEAATLAVGMTHGHHPARTHHDVDLGGGEAVGGATGVVHGHVEVVAVAHELRSLLHVAEGFDHGGVEPEPMGEQGPLLVGGVDEIDPDHGRTAVDGGGGVATEVGGIERLASGHAGGVAPRRDHGRTLRMPGTLPGHGC